MNLTIKPMNMLEYLLVFSGDRSALSDQYAGESAKYSLLLGARADGEYAGFLCCLPETGFLRIAYVYTIEKFRRQGICTELVRFVTEKSSAPVRINVVSGAEYHEAIVAVCGKLGFFRGESVQVFTCQRENFPSWQAFMEKRGNRLVGYLEHRGYEAVSFADAGEDLIEQLIKSPRSDYENTLDPAPFLQVPEKKMSWEMSFAAVKEGRLASYTLVTRISQTKVIFEHISDSALERGTGCILLPFAKAMEAFDASGCETVSYAMYESNLHANAFRNKLLDVLNTTKTMSENYYFKK